VQLCANNVFSAAKAAQVLLDVGVDYDFVDLNLGCPLEPIFRMVNITSLGDGSSNLHSYFVLAGCWQWFDVPWTKEAGLICERNVNSAWASAKIIYGQDESRCKDQ
jgi:hypothetical protein